MTEDKEYKDLLSRRLEGAYDTVYPADEVPSAEDILRWQNMAEAKEGERKVRIRRLSTLAAVFLVSLALGVAIMVEPPKAEAGGDGKLEISYIDEQEEHFAVEKYKDVESVPDDIKEQYIMFDELPEGYEISSVQITYSGNTEILNMFIKKGEKIIVINQWRVPKEHMNQVILRKGEKEIWDEEEVYISEYEYNSEEVAYTIEYAGMLVNITANKEIPKREIKEIVMKKMGE